ncbi:MAG: HlyD family efflux transporter periplasmic adaptor subunit, partial [Planctomycetota bacterium]
RAQQHVDTLRQLQSEGNGASREVQLAESDLQLAENDLRAVEEQRALDQLDLKRIDAEMMGRRIVANTSGVVIDVLRQPGEFVSLSDPVVITLVQLKQLRIQFYAPIEIADSLRKGQTTTLQFLHDRQTARANVTYVSPVIDANSNTVRVDVILNNTDGRYQSGRRCILLAKPTGNATTRSTRSSMQGFLR